MRTIRRSRLFAGSLVVAMLPIVASAPTAEAGDPPVAGAADAVGVVDTIQGIWYLRDPASGATTSFYYGNPGDTPFMGDWDCDGVDTPGLHRRSDGYVYLRNTNSQGIADVSFFFGNPGDVPLAGDFDGDGCDTVSLFRPSEGRFYVINELGSGDAGLGAADIDFVFGNPSDVPIVGDWDGDGIDTVGMRRAADGFAYLRNEFAGGSADLSFAYGDPGDVVVSGSWDGRDGDSLGSYRPSTTTFHLRNSRSAGAADISVMYGNDDFAPITGRFGPLPGGDDPPAHDVYVVAEFTTFHPPNEARNINIDLIADMTDGAVVQPGEIFSLNAHVGQRTIEKGFVAAGAIIGGEVYCCDHPINIGGGTSQFATTLYNAVFFGGYEDVFHRPHSLYFSRYPVAREATLGFPSPDVQFRNDTAYPLTIDTSHTSTSVTVRLIGNNEGRVVATSTVGRVSPDTGGTATVYRWITFANGTSTVESWTHTYRVPIDEEPEEPPAPPPGPEPL